MAEHHDRCPTCGSRFCPLTRRPDYRVHLFFAVLTVLAVLGAIGFAAARA